MRMRMQRKNMNVWKLIGDKIVSAKDFEQARLNYENAKVAWEAVAGKQTANGGVGRFANKRLSEKLASERG